MLLLLLLPMLSQCCCSCFCLLKRALRFYGCVTRLYFACCTLHTHTPPASATTPRFCCGRLPAVLFIFFLKMLKEKQQQQQQQHKRQKEQ